VVETDELLAMLTKQKAAGLTASAVILSFCQRLTQLIKDRVLPAYEYWGSTDPTQEQARVVSGEEARESISHFMKGAINNLKAPSAFSLKNPVDPVRF